MGIQGDYVTYHLNQDSCESEMRAVKNMRTTQVNLGSQILPDNLEHMATPVIAQVYLVSWRFLENFYDNSKDNKKLFAKASLHLASATCN